MYGIVRYIQYDTACIYYLYVCMYMQECTYYVCMYTCKTNTMSYLICTTLVLTPNSSRWGGLVVNLDAGGQAACILI